MTIVGCTLVNNSRFTVILPASGAAMLIDRFPPTGAERVFTLADARAVTTFLPYQALAQTLLPLTLESDDGSHDVAHLHRVWKNCRRISKLEGGDRRILCAAVLLHDAVAVEKTRRSVIWPRAWRRSRPR